MDPEKRRRAEEKLKSFLEELNKRGPMPIGEIDELARTVLGAKKWMCGICKKMIPMEQEGFLKEDLVEDKNIQCMICLDCKLKMVMDEG